MSPRESDDYTRQLLQIFKECVPRVYNIYKALVRIVGNIQGTVRRSPAEPGI